MEIVIKWASRNIRGLSQQVLQEVSKKILPDGGMEERTEREEEGPGVDREHPPAEGPATQQGEQAPVAGWATEQGAQVPAEGSTVEQGEVPEDEGLRGTQVSAENIVRRQMKLKRQGSLVMTVHRPPGEWALEPLRGPVAIGDSNMSRLPHPLDEEEAQLVSFPGARWTHISTLLKQRTPTSLSVKKLIISIGINDRNGNPTLVEKAIMRGYKTGHKP